MLNQNNKIYKSCKNVRDLGRKTNQALIDIAEAIRLTTNENEKQSLINKLSKLELGLVSAITTVLLANNIII